MEKICVFPGTFDPLTLGHQDIIDRAAPLFDRLIIGIGTNGSKQPMFPAAQREEWIRRIYAHDPRIGVHCYEGLTVEFCKAQGAKFLLRGIRYVSDFEYEKAIADMNRMLSPEIETVFLTCSPQFSTFSSTLVRDVIRNHGAAHLFVSDQIIGDIEQ